MADGSGLISCFSYDALQWAQMWLWMGIIDRSENGQEKTEILMRAQKRGGIFFYFKTANFLNKNILYAGNYHLAILVFFLNVLDFLFVNNQLWLSLFCLGRLAGSGLTCAIKQANHNEVSALRDPVASVLTVFLVNPSMPLQCKSIGKCRTANIALERLFSWMYLQRNVNYENGIFATSTLQWTLTLAWFFKWAAWLNAEPQISHL